MIITISDSVIIYLFIIDLFISGLTYLKRDLNISYADKIQETETREF